MIPPIAHQGKPLGLGLAQCQQARGAAMDASLRGPLLRHSDPKQRTRGRYRANGGPDEVKATPDQEVDSAIRKSSIARPAARSSFTQRGCLPRPDQVIEGSSGFQIGRA